MRAGRALVPRELRGGLQPREAGHRGETTVRGGNPHHRADEMRSLASPGTAGQPVVRTQDGRIPGKCTATGLPSRERGCHSLGNPNADTLA